MTAEVKTILEIVEKLKSQKEKLASIKPEWGWQQMSISESIEELQKTISQLSLLAHEWREH